MSGGAGSASGERTPPLHVVVLGPYLRFPHGMAGTSRIRLVTRALRESGADVLVLCPQASERPPAVQNTSLSGAEHGVRFEYTTWTTVRQEQFLARRLVAAWGWVHAALRLVGLKMSGALDVAYVCPDAAPRWHQFAGLALLKLLSVPVVWELNERPWSLGRRRTLVRRLWSPLAGMDGVVAISDYLAAWVRTEEQRLCKHVELIEVPIVVDVDEQAESPYPADSPPSVLFAGSPVYDSTIRFILAAMQEVWERVPECRLIVTGANPGDPHAGWLYGEAEREPRILVPGYVSRVELLELYTRSRALLIPLFDDVQSQARFPTKIGEYLASGRPVVTTCVGEVPRHLEDGVNAFVCPPGDASLFAASVLRVLEDAQGAAAVGREGRRMALGTFQYSLYSDVLRRGFDKVARRG